MMTRDTSENSTAVGPVLQFTLLLTPLVLNCFFLVYSLTGWGLEGQDMINWSVEAPDVGMWVAFIMVLFSGLVIAYTLWRGGSRWHPLVVSSIGHIIVALLLTLSIFVTVKL